MSIIQERMTVVAKEEFALFLIGMRINRPWKVHKWLPPFMAMTRMMQELYTETEHGLLSHNMAFGRTIILIQYWKSVEHLNAYSKQPDREHLPARKAFTKAIGSNGDVGIWHETYRITAGTQECVYHNMPRFGLGKAMELVPAQANLCAAKGRMEAGVRSPPPG